MRMTGISATVIAAAILLAASAVCFAQGQSPTESIDLWNVRQNFKTMIDVAEKGDPGYQPQLDLLIDQTMHLLRGPLPGGNSYAFATIRRDDKAEPIDLSDTKVDVTVESGNFQKISAEIAMPYELEIFCPSQRGFFKNNGDVFVKSYKVELIIDGAKNTVERDFNAWIHAGEGQKIPLPGVAQWARIEINTAVNRSDVNHAIVELRARVPEIEDDPRNPYTFSLKELKQAREYNALGAKRKTVVEKLHSSMDGLDYVPTTTLVPAAPGLDKAAIAQKLEYIQYLLQGKDADKDEALKALNSLIEELKK